MKYIILCAVFFISVASIAQDTKQVKNRISFGVITPYEVDGLGPLMSDDWVMISNLSDENSRSYDKIGFQLKYYRSLGKGQLGIRIGTSKREIEETQQFTGYWDSSAPNPVVYRINNYSLEYSQRNYFVCFGAKNEARLGPLLLSFETLGLLNRLGPSKQVYRELHQFHDASGMPEQVHHHWDFYWETDGGWMLGPGAELGAGINLAKKVTLSAGIGMYFLYSYFDGKVVHWNESFTDDRITHAMEEGSYSRYDEVNKLQVSQWSFSKPALWMEVGVGF